MAGGVMQRRRISAGPTVVTERGELTVQRACLNIVEEGKKQSPGAVCSGSWPIDI